MSTARLRIAPSNNAMSAAVSVEIAPDGVVTFETANTGVTPVAGSVSIPASPSDIAFDAASWARRRRRINVEQGEEN